MNYERIRRNLMLAKHRLETGCTNLPFDFDTAEVISAISDADVAIFQMMAESKKIESVSVTERERLALLGDRQAQAERTKNCAVLPCPCCGSESAWWKTSETKNENGFYDTWIECKKCGTCSVKIRSESDCYNGKCGLDAALESWNTRPAPPFGRCKDCTRKEKATVNAKGFLICPASGMEIEEEDYCSYFEENGKEDEA